jgi:hypothetical protein
MTKAIILDANRIGRNMREEVKTAIHDRGVKILIFSGGKLETELKGRRERGGTRYREYAKNGFFHYICKTSVVRKNNHLIERNLIDCNDQHIIALALVSGANTLHTEDNSLICNFHNCQQIDESSDCISGRPHPQRRVIKANSPISKETRRLLLLAEANFGCCECMINSGGC